MEERHRAIALISAFIIITVTFTIPATGAGQIFGCQFFGGVGCQMGSLSLTIPAGATGITSATQAFPSAFTNNPTVTYGVDYLSANTANSYLGFITENILLSQPPQIQCLGTCTNTTNLFTGTVTTWTGMPTCLNCVAEWLNTTVNEFQMDSTSFGNGRINVFFDGTQSNCDCRIILQALISGTWTTCSTSQLFFAASDGEYPGTYTNFACKGDFKFRLAEIWDMTPTALPVLAVGRVVLDIQVSAINTLTFYTICGTAFVPCKTKFQIRIQIQFPIAASTTVTVAWLANG